MQLQWHREAAVGLQKSMICAGLMHLVWRRASQLAAPQRALEPSKSVPVSAQRCISCSHPVPNILTGDMHNRSPEVSHETYKVVVGDVKLYEIRHAACVLWVQAWLEQLACLADPAAVAAAGPQSLWRGAAISCIACTSQPAQHCPATAQSHRVRCEAACRASPQLSTSA